MPHRARGECARACRRRPIGRSSRAGCCAAASPWGYRGPLAARAQDVHEAVGYLAQVDRPLVAAALGGRDQWGDQRPFLVGQVTWVAQLATVVATTVLTRPHQRLPPNRAAAKEITTNSKHSRCSRMDTNSCRNAPSSAFARASLISSSVFSGGVAHRSTAGSAEPFDATGG